MCRARSPIIFTAIAILCWAGSAAAQDKPQPHPCDDPAAPRRIEACTQLIETPGISEERLATAYAGRALSYSLAGQFEAAVRDLDQAVHRFPQFAVALNNRAWAKLKLGRLREALEDAEASLKLDHTSMHALDTRAHIHHRLGNKVAAMTDYLSAVRQGGTRMISLYQCGLRLAGVYTGPVDGKAGPALPAALKACIDRGAACDPLPPDETDAACKK